MRRALLMICVLTAAPLFGQALGQQAPAPAQNAHPPVNLPPLAFQPVAPDAPVITIHGVCAQGQASTPEKTGSCTLVLTRAQFETMVSNCARVKIGRAHV